MYVAIYINDVLTFRNLNTSRSVDIDLFFVSWK